MSSSCGSQALQVSGVWLKILLRGQITLYVLLQLNGRQLYYCLRLRVVVEYLLAGVLLSSVVDVTLSTLLFMFHLISFSLHVIVHVSSYFLQSRLHRSCFMSVPSVHTSSLMFHCYFLQSAIHLIHFAYHSPSRSYLPYLVAFILHGHSTILSVSLFGQSCLWELAACGCL